jgi:hypothetical protein
MSWYQAERWMEWRRELAGTTLIDPNECWAGAHYYYRRIGGGWAVDAPDDAAAVRILLVC